MIEPIDMHEPLLTNTIGHAVGLLLFAGFLVLVLRDRRKSAMAYGRLPVFAAAAALLWNAGSLYVLAASTGLLAHSDFAASLSFAILSLLPALLLHLSLGPAAPPVRITGYVLSACAVALHLAEPFRPDLRFHQAALWVIVIGFGILTVIAMFTTRGAIKDAARVQQRRIAASMCLFVFAISFVHFGGGSVRSAWSSEIAIHHAGIPLALFVLMQDYRFLLLDAFLRFLASSVVASSFVVLSILANERFHILRNASQNPFLQGTLIVTASLVLVGLVAVRGRLQVLLTRVVFRRRDREPIVEAIRSAGAVAVSEAQLLESSAAIIARFARTSRSEVQQNPGQLPMAPTPAQEMPSLEAWVEVCVPVKFLKGDGALILLGRREGSRRYLSEDLQELVRLAAVVAEQVERLRNSEIQRLVSQAELRALQSQINPHFLFNALNTLYGTIPRESAEARRLVLNLAEIFRYSLQTDRTLITLSEELQIVTAYLEIEHLRLGDKLQTQIEVDDSARNTMIPVLTVQPLVENAVKHGVADNSAPGMVRFRARTVEAGVRIEVSDNGHGFRENGSKSRAGSGVGLDNVRQRLKLCFGEAANLEIESTDRGSTVGFLIPSSTALL